MYVQENLDVHMKSKIKYLSGLLDSIASPHVYHDLSICVGSTKMRFCSSHMCIKAALEMCKFTQRKRCFGADKWLSQILFPTWIAQVGVLKFGPDQDKNWHLRGLMINH